VHKATDDLQAIITTRVLAEAERLEAEHARIRDEEAARLERERQEMEAAQTRAAVPAATIAAAEVAAVPAAGKAETPGRSVPEAAPSDAPTLTLGTICDRLGLTVTSDLLARLGYPHTQQRQAKLYRETDFGRICHALAAHILRAA
jgi:hypothetical protein